MRLLLLALLPFALSLSQAAERPNLLFIFMDDYGWKDTSYAGSDFYETPNIDALATGGMIFDNAYSAAANCAPARACLLSGQYTPRHELFNVGTGPRGKAQHRRLEHIPGVAHLRTDVDTWAKQLKDAGYRTATMGKWHLSKDPIPYGFDLNVGGTTAGGPPKGYFPPHPNAPGLGNVPKGEYLTDTLSNRAADFIRTHKDKPWCLYLTHFAVHTPIQARKDLIEKYKAKEPGTLHQHAVMAAMIESVDQGVGTIVRTLDELKLRENTVIIFFSDNGGYGPATSMAPLKGYKGTYYEGGIRVPFFVNWPGTVKSGTTCSEPIIGVDLYPTLCDLGKAKLPEDQPLDGRSLVPLFSGKAKSLDRKAIYWHFPAYLQSYNGVKDEAGNQRDVLFRSRPCSIIRVGKYKLHEYFEDGGIELYDLDNDLSETRNLAKNLPEKAAELHQMLKDWRKKIKAPVPTKRNPAYDADVEAAAIAKRLNPKSANKRKK
jgi:arylsulfatase A-like enzyme